MATIHQNPGESKSVCYYLYWAGGLFQGLVVTGQKWKHKPSEKEGSCTVTSVTESEHTEFAG